MTDDTRIRTYTDGRDKGERTRGPDESITLHIYHELSSSFMASQQWETRKQKCGIYTPVARKVSTFIISHKSQSVTRQRFFFYSECYYYVTRANVRIDGVYLRFVFACLSLFSYSSKVNVTFEKCEVNVSSSFLSFYHRRFIVSLI